MNYLAHFHLALEAGGDDQPGLITGALLGDYVKGPLANSDLPDEIIKGIALHRYIDAVSDRSDSLSLFKMELEPELRRYAGMIWDVFCDHYLSLNWSRFSRETLTATNERVCRQLQRDEALMPESAHRMSQALQDYGILLRYHEPEAIGRALERLSQRLRKHRPLAQSTTLLNTRRSALNELFLEFYPRLHTAVLSFER